MTALVLIALTIIICIADSLKTRKAIKNHQAEADKWIRDHRKYYDKMKEIQNR